MRTANLRVVPWLIIAGLCAGCPRLSICVTVPDARASNFVVKVADGNDCNEPAVVTRMVIRRISDGTVFWTIGSVDGAELTVVNYGQVPPGFDQGPAVLPLTPGDRVNITVNGRGTSGGIDVTIAP